VGAHLIVVSGPPGAGKSTLSAGLATLFSPSALIPGDAFFGFVRRGYIDPWTEAASAQNATIGRAAAAAAGCMAAGGYTGLLHDQVTG
jgi:adenylate kinase family enzyme